MLNMCLPAWLDGGLKDMTEKPILTKSIIIPFPLKSSGRIPSGGIPNRNSQQSPRLHKHEAVSGVKMSSENRKRSKRQGSSSDIRGLMAYTGSGTQLCPSFNWGDAARAARLRSGLSPGRFGAEPRWQCDAKACSALPPTALPVVVSHSITMPPLCLPHSYYEVACLKKTKKGRGFCVFIYIYAQSKNNPNML